MNLLSSSNLGKKIDENIFKSITLKIFYLSLPPYPEDLMLSHRSLLCSLFVYLLAF